MDLVAAQEDHDGHQEREDRHLQQHVEGEEVARDGDARVPEGVQHDGADQPERAGSEGRARSAAGAVADGDAGDHGERHVRERREQAPQDERADERARGARDERAAEVDDVLREGEAGRDGGAVDDAVHRAVEVPARDPEDEEQPDRLRGLLDDGRLDGELQELRVARGHADREARVLRDEVEEERDRHGRGRAPQQREQQGEPRLGLPAVDPADGEEHAGERDQGEERADRDGLDPEAEHEVRGDDQADEQQHRDAHDAEHGRRRDARRRVRRGQLHGRRGRGRRGTVDGHGDGRVGHDGPLFGGSAPPA
ncbi:hypothetical protein CMMCAS03_15200 [Clavibacter michiganensis subsp. michiganensis]|nr:hypothetical protein CMMCAS03_15200 [Clavibacter michiganensis subsp. michiganensis]